MDRKVSQKEFNELVKENVEEFEMEEDEAIEFAASQLEAQGVNLKMIILDKDVVQGVDDLSKFSRLYGNVEELDEQILQECLEMMDRACSLAAKDVKYKIHAGNLNIHNILIKIMKSQAAERDVVIKIITNLIKIVSGYPDLINETTIVMLLDLIDVQDKENSALLPAARLILEGIKKHEENKNTFFNKKMGRNLIKTLIGMKLDETVLIGCDIISHLGLDDDIRVEISGAHTRATTLANDHLLDLYLTLKIQEEKSDVENVKAHLPVTSAVLRSVTSMAVTNDLVLKLYEADPDFLIIRSLLKRFSKEQDVLHYSNKLLASISGNDDCKSAMAPLIPLIVKVVDENLANSRVIHSSFLVISSLTLRNKKNAMEFIELHAVEKITQALKVLKDNKVRRSGCLALRNIASSSKVTQPFNDCGVVELMNSFLKIDPLIEEAKSVLVALGAPVALTERWTGVRGDVVAENQRQLGL